MVQDVSSLFRGKNCEQLELLEETIKRKMKEELGIDIGYWESVLSQLVANKARARLREKHQVLLEVKLQRLKQQVKIKLNIFNTSKTVLFSYSKVLQVTFFRL